MVFYYIYICFYFVLNFPLFLFVFVCFYLLRDVYYFYSSPRFLITEYVVSALPTLPLLPAYCFNLTFIFHFQYPAFSLIYFLFQVLLTFPIQPFRINSISFLFKLPTHEVPNLIIFLLLFLFL